MRIVRLSKKNARLNAPEIRNELNLTEISSRTIQRRLDDAGLYGRRPAFKPWISSKNIKERLEFAKRHVNWTSNDWKAILWSDESKFNLFNNDGKGYVRRPKNKRFDSKYTVGTVKFGGGHICVWGCFSWHSVGPICRIEGKMDQLQYREILSNTMLPHFKQDMPRESQFQHDNDPKHTAKLVKQWLVDNEIPVMKWPAQSPDLNPIENLWGEVERRIRGCKFHNSDQLFRVVNQEWNLLPKTLIEKLVESMPRRCQAVIDAKGYSTKY